MENERDEGEMERTEKNKCSCSCLSILFVWMCFSYGIVSSTTTVIYCLQWMERRSGVSMDMFDFLGSPRFELGDLFIYLFYHFIFLVISFLIDLGNPFSTILNF